MSLKQLASFGHRLLRRAAATGDDTVIRTSPSVGFLVRELDEQWAQGAKRGDELYDLWNELRSTRRRGGYVMEYAGGAAGGGGPSAAAAPAAAPPSATPARTSGEVGGKRQPETGASPCATRPRPAAASPVGANVLITK